MKWSDLLTVVGGLSGFFTFVGGLSGFVAVLTFVFAAHRDRQSWLMQIALQRSEELRSGIEQFLAASVYLRMLEILDARFKEQYETKSSDGDVNELRDLLTRQSIESAKASAEQSLAYFRALMLLNLSYHAGISDELVAAMSTSDLKHEMVMQKAAVYMNAEWSRVMAGQKPKQLPNGEA